MGELKQAFAQLKEDVNAKVIVLRAEGKAFCAGADLAYIQGLQNNTYEENFRRLESFEGVYSIKFILTQK